MTQDERRALKKKRMRQRWVLQRVCVLLALILVVLLIILAVLKLTGGATVKKELTVEAGLETVDADRFLEEGESGASFGESLTPEELSTPGSYPVEILWKGRTYRATVTVKDTVAPVATPVNVTCFGDLPVPARFVKDIQDATEVTVTYKAEPDVTTAGQKDVTVIMTDTSGNKTEVDAKLMVFIDAQPPVISGVSPLVVYQGDAISYRNGITVSDDMDANPVLNVDNSAVNLSAVGTYKLVYTATDAAGNITTEETTVDVREKQDWFVELDVIYEKVDALLEKLVTDSMSKREQVETIYKWARTNCSYSSHSDKSDYLQGAYVMLTERTGDCFNYFAVTKLMFERLGIDNIDVKKVKNYEGDSNHYWSLVSLDDGETWYHFDATPRMGTGDDFCLVTDAFLDAYSAAHKNCHNRDKTLYPATPEN